MKVSVFPVEGLVATEPLCLRSIVDLLREYSCQYLQYYTYATVVWFSDEGVYNNTLMEIGLVPMAIQRCFSAIHTGLH